MDIQVTGRRCQIPEPFREHVKTKLETIDKFRGRVERIEVQVTAQESKTPHTACTVDISLIGPGPIVRAQGQSEDKFVAFDAALERLRTQLRKAADRRKTRAGLRHSPVPIAILEEQAVPVAESGKEQPRTIAGDVQVTGDGPLVVREKVFETPPLTLAQALDEMELVGHDFFLYVDAETKQPSVVYRRKAYDYGVIHLNLS